MSNLIGQSIGRYHIREQLGQGGMATVYKAYDTRLERDVAIKVIRTGAFPAEQLEQILKRFEREGKALARLSHPNIVGVIDYGDYEGSPYLVMEYLPGGTLKQKLGKPMPWREALGLILPVGRALKFAHDQGIVHRDVKPANILTTLSGEPMLTDFGIAKLLEDASSQTLTGTGVGLGTPEYMAPEQWTGQAGAQADIYSLGIVLFELVTGRKPYTADTPAAVLLKQVSDPLPSPSKIVPALPEQVDRLLFKALAKKTEERFPTMGAFIEAMEKLLAGNVPDMQDLSVGADALTRDDFSPPVMTAGKPSLEQPAASATAVNAQPAVKDEFPAWAASPLPPAPKAKKGGNKAWIWILALIVVPILLCLGACLIMWVASICPPEGPWPQPPWCPGSSFSLSSPTNTVSVIPTTTLATMVPTASPNLYQDDFSDPNSGWATRDNEGNIMEYTSGVYRVMVASDYLDLIASAGASLPTNVIVEVDATKNSGTEDNDFGVMCRLQDLDNFYFFQVSSDGYAVIGKFENNEMKYLSADAMQKVDGIRSGSNVNRIRADCIGSTLQLYVNGNLVATATDSTFTGGGDVGLMAGTFSEGGVEIFFDNLVVRAP